MRYRYPWKLQYQEYRFRFPKTCPCNHEIWLFYDCTNNDDITFCSQNNKDLHLQFMWYRMALAYEWKTSETSWTDLVICYTYKFKPKRPSLFSLAINNPSFKFAQNSIHMSREGEVWNGAYRRYLRSCWFSISMLLVSLVVVTCISTPSTINLRVFFRVFRWRLARYE